MISGTVAGVDFRNTGGADPFGEGKDLCVGLIVEVEGLLLFYPGKSR